MVASLVCPLFVNYQHFVFVFMAKREKNRLYFIARIVNKHIAYRILLSTSDKLMRHQNGQHLQIIFVIVSNGRAFVIEFLIIFF